MVYFKYTVSVTTVKVYEETKLGLDEIRLDSESYDDIISRLILKFKRSMLRNNLKEGYLKNNADDLKLANEWENSSLELI